MYPEYRLDDGQTKVQTIYRSMNQIIDSVRGLEVLIQYYKNQCSPQTTVLRPHENIRKYK